MNERINLQKPMNQFQSTEQMTMITTTTLLPPRPFRVDIPHPRVV